MRIYNLFLLFFVILCGSNLAQGHEARLEQLDILHYKFGVILDDASDNIQGDAAVTVKFKKTSPEMVLDLVKKNSDGKGMTVQTVAIDGTPVEFTHDGESLTLKFDEPMAAGAQKRIRILYSGVPQDGLIISKNKFGNRTFFGDNWPNRGHHYLPMVDHPSDKATVEFVVTAPEHYQVVANGQMKERSNISPGTLLTHWKSSVPLPTKVMVFGAAAFAVGHAGHVNHIPVTSWVYPENRDAGFHDYAMAAPILKYYMDLIARYPYEKLANVQSKTRYGGMENAGCIFYNEESVDGERGSEGLIAHEIVHQWFGNSASEATWHHIWLSEGFATYLTHMYFQDTQGDKVFNKRMQEDRTKVVGWASTKSSPVVDTRIKDWNMLLNPNSYQKGGWVLHMLRHKIGDLKFKEGIKAYYDEYKISNATTEDFQKVMEKKCGYSLSSFFKQWIYRAGHPELDVKWTYKKGKVTVDITQKQEGAAFVFPLEVAFLVPGAKAPFIKNYNIEEKEHSFSFELTGEPSQVILDPKTKLLFEGAATRK